MRTTAHDNRRSRGTKRDPHLPTYAHTGHDAVDGVLEVRVVEDQHRRVPAQLQGHLNVWAWGFVCVVFGR